MKVDDAKKLAIAWIQQQIGNKAPLEITKVYEKSYGYIFTYNDKRYLTTGDRRYSLLGATPVLVETTNNSVSFLEIPLDVGRLSYEEMVDYYDRHSSH